jgi:hypothetical protein
MKIKKKVVKRMLRRLDYARFILDDVADAHAISSNWRAVLNGAYDAILSVEEELREPNSRKRGSKGSLQATRPNVHG